MNRVIIFGDIHGCHDEWQDLLDRVGIVSGDLLVAVGDLICRGPLTRKTLDLAMTIPNFRAVLGNHEYSLLNHWRKRRPAKEAHPCEQSVILELGNDFDPYMTFLESWPFYLDLQECLVVHAGLRPGIALETQSPEDLTNLRTLGPDARPWYDFYDGKKLVVHGHWAKQGLIQRPNVIGLDSGCVYGGALSALILPERKIVSVPARKGYAPVKVKK